MDKLKPCPHCHDSRPVNVAEMGRFLHWKIKLICPHYSCDYRAVGRGLTRRGAERRAIKRWNKLAQEVTAGDADGKFICLYVKCGHHEYKPTYINTSHIASIEESNDHKVLLKMCNGEVYDTYCSFPKFMRILNGEKEGADR